MARPSNGVTKLVGRLLRRGAADPPRAAAPVGPETTAATVEPIRVAARRSAVPRWLAETRTRAFSGMAAFSLVVFGTLTLLVDAGLTASADLAATLTVQQVDHPWFAALMELVSALGFPPFSLILVGGVVALFFVAGYRTESLFSLLASASALLTQTLKVLVGRPRPDGEIVRVVETAALGGNSFPSGHTLFYVTFFGFIAYAAYALLKPGRLRVALLWLCGLLILLVGPSRIWLGHHWASDVLASYALGLAYLILLVQVYSRVRLRTG